MDKIIFQVRGFLTGIKTKTNSWEIKFETDENVPGDKIAIFADLKNKPGYMTVSSHLVEAEDIIDLPPIRPVEKSDKTPSERLRSVMFLLWKQNSEGFKTADEYYRFKMEKLINHYKDHLDG